LIDPDPDFAGGKRAEGLFLTQAFALVDGFRPENPAARCVSAAL
jgi:hypothetical protein